MSVPNATALISRQNLDLEGSLGEPLPVSSSPGQSMSLPEFPTVDETIQTFLQLPEGGESAERDQSSLAPPAVESAHTSTPDASTPLSSLQSSCPTRADYQTECYNFQRANKRLKDQVAELKRSVEGLKSVSIGALIDEYVLRMHIESLNTCTK